MHTVRLLLDATKSDEQIIAKRFYAIAHIHNVIVKRASKLMSKLNKNEMYQSVLNEYCSLLKKSNLTKEDKLLKKDLSFQLNAIRIELGLSEYQLQSYITKCAKQYRKCLAAQQVQKEASRVWRGVEKTLFSKGKRIHFKKHTDFSTIGGKSNANGVKFNKDTLSIEWIGLKIHCKLPKKNEAYLKESLDNDISYCEIERKMFPNGWHYYVIVCLKGDAPKRLVVSAEGKAGVDIGTSTVAIVSDNKALLEELAPQSKKYNKKIQKLLQSLDVSRRCSNPDKYNADGTVKKNNKDKWKFSKSYIKKQQKLKSLYRQKSAYIKNSHEQLCNKLIKGSNVFFVEDMDFKTLQRRAKSAEKQERSTVIQLKNGTTKPVYKFKKKKRFGRSLNNRAPALFVEILKDKVKQYNGNLFKVNTREFKASQYNHSTDEYTPCAINNRNKIINGVKVQRDLYSAFLLKNSNAKLDKPDRDKCIRDFGKFVDLQNNLISDMKKKGITFKQCFGF